MMESHSKALSDAERLDRLRLYRSENVGPITFRQLLSRYKTAGEALKAIPDLAARGGRKRKIRIQPASEALAELEKLQALGGVMVHAGEADFPAPLAAVEDGPPLLAVIGHPHLLTRPCAAIVGTRNASTNGRRIAQSFARAFGEAGFTVVSGLARGIDTAAHSGAIDHGTVACMAGGVDIVYPKENDALYRDIADRGALVSEQPMGTTPQARHFPRRNRIVSGLSAGVLVVEAKLRSGSLITARYAADQGREVMAVPGSPLDPRANGSNDLIRKGAALVENPQDAIAILRSIRSEQLSHPAGPPFDPPSIDVSDAQANDARARIAEHLGPDPVDVDDLIRDLELPPAAVMMALLELELAGELERFPGGRVAKLFSPDA